MQEQEFKVFKRGKGVTLLDKLEVRIPQGATFSREFAPVYRELAHSPEFSKYFKPSLHYLKVGDLRPFDISAVLHFGNKHGREGNHKLELLDTGKMTYSAMVNEIERVFEINGPGLDVMRIDAAIDVPVPVEWFHRHARVKYKQFADQIGKTEIQTMGKGGLQTLYFGKRPNCIRIYNKTAEYQHQYSRLLTRLSQEVKIAPFEELFGCEETAVITRVERQMAAGRVPHKFTIVGTLKCHGSEFNPFAGLEFKTNHRMYPEPTVQEWGLRDFGFGTFLRHKIEAEGMHFVRAWLNKHSNKNTQKIIDKYLPFFPHNSEEGPGITEKELFERYRDSFCRQMAA